MKDDALEEGEFNPYAAPAAKVQDALYEIYFYKNWKCVLDANTRFTGWNIFGLVVGGILFAMAVLGSFFPE